MTADVAGGGLETRFALGALATWRLTHLVAEEDGPGDAVLRLRALLGSGPLGKLMDCFACSSIWVSAPVSLAVTHRRRELPLVWLALSGAACLLERMAHRGAAEQSMIREPRLDVVDRR
jgi:hypothetical protein